MGAPSNPDLPVHLTGERGRPGYSWEVKETWLALWTSGLGYGPACDRLGLAGTTVQGWREQDELFSHRYDAARAERAARLADETLAIADEATPETTRLAALRVGARQWWAERGSRDFASRQDVTTAARHEVVIRLEGAAAYRPQEVARVQPGALPALPAASPAALVAGGSGDVAVAAVAAAPRIAAAAATPPAEAASPTASDPNSTAAT